MVSPEGGPKDTTPPSVTGSDPANFSTGFTGKNIHIEFDEFINAETSGDKVLVSPPLADVPDYRLRGKGLVITFEDTLLSNVTYTIDFGNAIADITEGNKLAGYRYIFSTGAYLDSMALSGKVADAFNNQPAKSALVQLYPPHSDTIPSDSIPVLLKPRYVTRTKDDGTFAFTHISPGRYLIIALIDKSGDMLFNMPGEQVAFLDSLVTPWYEKPVVADTASADTLEADTSYYVTPAPVPSPLSLRIFEPKDSTQILDRSDILRDNMAQLVFRYPPSNLRIVPLNADSLAEWSLLERGTTGDTLTLWLLPGLPDTVILKVSADRMLNDTIELSRLFREPPKKGKKQESEVVKRLEVRDNIRGGLFNFLKGPLLLTTSYPLAKTDLSGLRIIDGKDTLQPEAAVVDSIRRKIAVRYRWTEGKPYLLFLPDSALMSLNGLANDTLRLRFKTAEARVYGNLKINVEVPEGTPQLIVQLMTEKEKVVEERTVKETGRISFDYILPANYKLKAILDRNSNGRWDSGDYFRKIQPELVVYFPRTLELRANWDIEETWKP